MTSFLAATAAQNGLAFVAPTTVVELAHLVIEAGFSANLPNHPDVSTGRPYSNWKQLYKRRSGLIRTYVRDIENLRQSLEANDIFVLQPDDLSPLADGRRFEDELIRLVRRYELDSSDAAILLEAHRAGIDSVATQDVDMQRARRDFDVYTWL